MLQQNFPANIIRTEGGGKIIESHAENSQQRERCQSKVGKHRKDCETGHPQETKPPKRVSVYKKVGGQEREQGEELLDKTNGETAEKDKSRPRSVRGRRLTEEGSATMHHMKSRAGGDSVSGKNSQWVI